MDTLDRDWGKVVVRQGLKEGSGWAWPAGTMVIVLGAREEQMPLDPRSCPDLWQMKVQ